jgi:thioredoxin-dependent peroxiredoxin
MNRAKRLALACAVGVAMGRGILACQEPKPLGVGAAAPDFALAGATSDGVLDQPVRLSNLRDQTVVIAFFYKARTKG